MQAIKEINTPVYAGFPVRRMDFDFAELQNKYIYDNQPAMSMFLTAMQSFFPDGEQFFIDSVRHFRNQIVDVQLQKDIGSFIGQEAMHGKEHRAANDALLEHGVDVSGLIAQMNVVWGLVKKHTSPKFQLAMTASLEHFTAVMGSAMLRNEVFIDGFNDPIFKNLTRWHAIEECEHKSVAFDTYSAVGGDFPERVVAMLISSLGIAIVFSASTAYLLKRDTQLTNLRSWKHLGRTLFGRRQGLFNSTLSEYLDWFHPKFHPKHHDTRDLERYWKTQLMLN